MCVLLWHICFVLKYIFLFCNVRNVQEEPELCWHPQTAFSGRQTARGLWHQPALHSPLLVWRPQLQTWLGRSGQTVKYHFVIIHYSFCKHFVVFSILEDWLDNTCGIRVVCENARHCFFLVLTDSRTSWNMCLRESLRSSCVQTSWPERDTRERHSSISVSFSLLSTFVLYWEL